MIPASEGTDGLVKGTVERLVRDTGAASLLGVAHWIRHTTLTWVERNFGYAIAKAYAGHTGNGSDAGVTATYVRATNEVSAALAALTAGVDRSGAITDLGPGGPPAARTMGPAGEDRSASASSGTRTVRAWPLLVLAAPAAAEVWSGWGRHRSEDRVRADPAIDPVSAIQAIKASQPGRCRP